MPKKAIAVVGAGISGLSAAFILHESTDVTLFEMSSCVGGNAHVIELETASGRLPVDAGVCAFHTVGYPNFLKLLSKLQVPTAKSDTSTEILSMNSNARYRFDLNSPMLSMLSGMFRPVQGRVLSDALRFYIHAKRSVSSNQNPETLGEHLSSFKYSESFRILMSFVCGATWTINHKSSLELPIHFLNNVFESIGFYPTLHRGHWRHVPGSVGRYLTALAKPFEQSSVLGTAVERVERDDKGVNVYYGGYKKHFDEVIFAIPPEKALELIVEPSQSEQEILSQFASTSYDFIFTEDRETAEQWTGSRPAIFAATDVENQSQEDGRDFLYRVGFTDITKMCCVNAPPYYMWYPIPNEPLPKKILETIRVATPYFNASVLRAQDRHSEVSGRDRLHFCGSAWANGIHEGGLRSALAVAAKFGKGIEDIRL